MTNVLCIGDPHFKVANAPETEEMINKLIELGNRIKPKFIVVLGDVLHRHETIHVNCLMRAEEMIRKLSEISPTYVIIGNHDRPNNSNYLTDEHPFNAMKKWNNTFIADKVLDLNIDSYRFIFVPYVPPGKFNDALATIEKPLEKVTCIFSHQEFYGAKMGAIISQAGDKWPLDNPLTVSGHIHDYQQLQPNIIYTGTAYQTSFGDKSYKTVSIFTFNKDETWNQERVDLGLKKRVIIYSTPEQFHNFEPPENKIIKLVIRGDEASIKAVAKLEKVQELKRLGVTVVFKEIRSDKNESSIKNISKITYRDRLFQEIEKDKKCVEWFNKLFN